MTEREWVKKILAPEIQKAARAFFIILGSFSYHVIGTGTAPLRYKNPLQSSFTLC